MAIGFKGKGAMPAKGGRKFPRAIKPGPANKGGTDGGMKGRSKMLAGISTAEDSQNAIPSQGQSGQFGAVAPVSNARKSVLQNFVRKGR